MCQTRSKRCSRWVCQVKGQAALSMELGRFRHSAIQEPEKGHQGLLFLSLPLSSAPHPHSAIRPHLSLLVLLCMQPSPVAGEKSSEAPGPPKLAISIETNTSPRKSTRRKKLSDLSNLPNTLGSSLILLRTHSFKTPFLNFHTLWQAQETTIRRESKGKKLSDFRMEMGKEESAIHILAALTG